MANSDEKKIRGENQDDLPTFNDAEYTGSESGNEPTQNAETSGGLDPNELSHQKNLDPTVTPDELDETRMAATDKSFLDQPQPSGGDEPTAPVDLKRSSQTGHSMAATEAETIGDTRAIPSQPSAPKVNTKADTVNLNETVPVTKGASSSDQTAQGSVAGANDQTLPVAPIKSENKQPTKKLDTHPQEVPEKHKPYLKLIGKSLDGYYIERLLGAGGMGAVYLAHQTSLDRKVAVKILPEKFAGNKKLLARFTREALSAGQLNHHNVMSVIDVGFDKGYHYISLEFVSGKSIGEMIRNEGRMGVDDAAGYILQACRGLDYAHTRGMIHRDIKPDNLMVNEHGVVKIADMGLAKMTHWEEKPEGLKYQENLLKSEAMSPDLTQAEIAMGTPSYMSPEQAQDTASVDFRADQYSLGCTLYYMCAGQAPYTGTTAFELMTKHIKEPIVPLEHHINSVPPAFKSIMEKMLSKEPEKRYPNLGEAAADIEAYLGIGSEGGVYRPRERHLKVLELSAEQFYNAPGMTHRWMAWALFFVMVPMMLLVAITLKSFAFIGAVIGFAVLTPLLGFVFDGYLNKSSLYLRSKRALLGMPLKNWAGVLFGGLLFLMILWVAGWMLWWVGVAILSTVCVAAYQLVIVKGLKSQREVALVQMNEILKELRLKGVGEDDLQNFVAKFTGKNWEEFFEEFFGYDAMIHARARSATSEKVAKRKKFATWRDPLARWLDGIEQARKEAKNRKTLEVAETEKLKEEGVSEADARKKALEEVDEIFKTGLLPSTVAEREAMLKKHRSPLKLPLKPILGIARFCIGLVMMIGYLAWLFRGMLPESAGNILFPYYRLSAFDETMSFAQTFYAGFIGVFMLVSSFSKRIVAPNLILFGGLLLALSYPLAAMDLNDSITSTTVWLISIGLSILGFGWCVLGKLTGGKF